MWLFNVNVREHLAHYALLPFQMPAKHEMSWKLCRSIQFCNNFWQIHSVKFTPSLPGLCQHGHNFLSRTWYTCIPADCAASWIHSKLQLNQSKSYPHSPGSNIFQTPVMAVLNVQVHLLHLCHEADSFSLAIEYCCEDRSPPSTVPLVEQEPRNSQQDGEAGHTAHLTSPVQSCKVHLVPRVHLDARRGRWQNQIKG